MEHKKNGSVAGSFAVTGHQPPALGGFGTETDRRLLALASTWIERANPGEVVSGMAPGWDMSVAEAAVRAGVPLVAALAWPGQGGNWPDDGIEQIRRLLSGASLVHVAFERRSPDMWTLRDQWVMARCERVVALWSGAPGGAATAVAYAASLGKLVDNLWDEWAALYLADIGAVPPSP